jgi:thiamine-monophosphate kinase
VILGPGDDAAVLGVSDGRVVTSTDLLLEQRHFRRDWSTANDVGHKAAARNFADIAAMGARPIALLVALGAPGSLELAWIDGLVSGLAEECGALGASVVGGDISAADHIILSVTAFGDLDGREPVRLSGAQSGNIVASCGYLGWAAAGFAVLTRGFRSPVQVVNAHRRPEPPYAQGAAAAAAGATAMTDISDGLLADLGHIAEASEVRIELRSDSLTPHAKLRDVASALNIDPMGWVLTGGDDYALVATFANFASIPSGWNAIGMVREGSGVRVDGMRWGQPLRAVDGPRTSGAQSQGGHEHFRS